MHNNNQKTTRNWLNIIVLGFGFFLLFSAFQTTVFIQTLTISGYLSPKCQNSSEFGVLSESFAGKVGYYSGAIIYLMVAIGNWASVSIVALVGAKWSLVFGGALYVVYIACLIRPLVYTVFIGAVLLGAGGGVLWTAQGQILIQNSSKERMSTTSGIFWFMFQMSLIVGSIYIFVYFYIERDHLTKLNCFPHEQNEILFAVLTISAVLGIVVLLFISPPSKNSLNSPTSSDGSINAQSSGERDPLMRSPGSSVMAGVDATCNQYHPIIQAIVNALRMMISKHMILLLFTFVYTGYELNYWSGVFGTIIGRTLLFPKYYIGMALFFIGLGEILGGAVFGIFGAYTNRWGRDLVVMVGFICHMIAFVCSFLFLPNDAIANDIAKEDSYGALGIYGVNSNVLAVMGSAFLLGFGDASYNTQLYSIIGVLYPEDDKSAPAMALYKFFQSIAAMVGFFTSTLIVLQWQLLALVVLAVIGTTSFCLVEWDAYRIELLRKNDLTLCFEDPSISERFVTKVSTEEHEENSDSSAY